MLRQPRCADQRCRKQGSFGWPLAVSDAGGAVNDCPGDLSRGIVAFARHRSWRAVDEAPQCTDEYLVLTIKDLHKGNVLLALPDISSLTVDELYTRYEKPTKEPVQRLDGKPIPPNVPSHVLPGVWMGKACEDLLLEDAGILLTDFGESWRPSVESRYRQKAPRRCRARESRRGGKGGRRDGLPADIWSLACLIYELFSKLTLFECFRPDVVVVFVVFFCLLGLLLVRW